LRPSSDNLAARVQRLALRQQSAAAEQSRANRARFPEFAEYLDRLSQLTGGRCRVRYLHDEASGYTVGRPGPIGVVACASGIVKK
jgi:hypothetical protein